VLSTCRGHRESACGRKVSRRRSESQGVYIAMRTVIATGEAAGGAAALTAAPECIKRGIGEEGLSVHVES
jgi:hypothetical protein